MELFWRLTINGRPKRRLTAYGALLPYNTLPNSVQINEILMTYSERARLLCAGFVQTVVRGMQVAETVALGFCDQAGGL